MSDKSILARTTPKGARSCNNCVNNDNGCCEEYGFFKSPLGIPVHVEPPYDEACDLWTDDPKEKNTWERYV